MSANHEALDAFIASLNLTYFAEFIEQRRSRNAGEKHPSLNWRVHIGGGPWKRDEHALTTDYTQGIGHIPGYCYTREKYEQRRLQDAQNDAANSGKYPAVVKAKWFDEASKRFKQTYRPAKSSDYKTDVAWRVRIIALPAPSLRDVLHSLVLDSDVLNASGFEQWASDLGYDTDSRKAEQTYTACRELAYKLQSLISDQNINKLRELFQDY